MEIRNTSLKGVILIKPDIFTDNRGWFMETYHSERYIDIGLERPFLQDNLSYSVKGTLRGLHFQEPHAQAKLVSVIAGEIFDVAVDIRYGSPSFGQWAGFMLSEENKNQLYIPSGFAHGFCVVSEIAYVTYKCSDLYAPKCEKGIHWSDQDLGIDWPVAEPVLSPKDDQYPFLRDCLRDDLPQYTD